MPIDPKKFKKIVNNHFDNLSEEEFLETLHKSSPYLFDGSLEANYDVSSSDQDKIISLKILAKLDPMAHAEMDQDFVLELAEGVNRMKLNNIDSIAIRNYIIKQEIIYIVTKIILSFRYKINKVFTKKT
jgi:hypothetical protein